MTRGRGVGAHIAKQICGHCHRGNPTTCPLLLCYNITLCCSTTATPCCTELTKQRGSCYIFFSSDFHFSNIFWYSEYQKRFAWDKFGIVIAAVRICQSEDQLLANASSCEIVRFAMMRQSAHLVTQPLDWGGHWSLWEPKQGETIDSEKLGLLRYNRSQGKFPQSKSVWQFFLYGNFCRKFYLLQLWLGLFVGITACTARWRDRGQWIILREGSDPRTEVRIHSSIHPPRHLPFNYEKWKYAMENY